MRRLFTAIPLLLLSAATAFAPSAEWLIAGRAGAGRTMRAVRGSCPASTAAMRIAHSRP